MQVIQSWLVYFINLNILHDIKVCCAALTKFKATHKYLGSYLCWFICVIKERSRQLNT